MNPVRKVIGVAKNLLPPELRRQIGVLYSDSKRLAFALPIVGRKMWETRIQRLEDCPSSINIEITSICNAKCIMCPRHLMDRKMEPMPFDLYERIIGEAKVMGIKNYVLNGYGEIFTMKKDYHKYIDYLLQEVPEARIGINTNASLMNEQVAQYLIDKKVDTVHVDIDGATKETFEKIRENLKYKMVSTNVRRLIEMRNEQNKTLPKVRVGMIVQKENRHEQDQFMEQWKGVADYVHGEFAVSRLGWFDVNRDKMVSNPCALPFFELTILSNGSVVMCCDDWNDEESMGNIHKSSLKEIWQGTKFKEFREYHQTGQADKISVCAKCDFARPGPSWFGAHRAKPQTKHVASKPVEEKTDKTEVA